MIERDAGEDWEDEADRVRQDTGPPPRQAIELETDGGDVEHGRDVQDGNHEEGDDECGLSEGQYFLERTEMFRFVWVRQTEATVVILLQLSEHDAVLSVGSKVLPLGDKLEHQTLDGNREDGALNEKLCGGHDDGLEESDGEDVAVQSIIPFIQHGGETCGDADH